MYDWTNCRLPAVTRIKPKRNKASRASNPIKALQQRNDLQSEYTETKSDVIKREMKRVNKAKGAILHLN